MKDDDYITRAQRKWKEKGKNGEFVGEKGWVKREKS